MIAADRQLRTDFLSGTGEMGALIRAYRWEDTPLGTIGSWPSSLKTSVSLILNSRHPMWIGWGPEMTFLYNDAYLHVLGAAKHGRSLGRPAAEVWAEIWDVCGPLADKVFRNGEATFVDDVRLFMDRGDFLEETFYSFSYSPIRDGSGRVCGLFCPSTDVTPKVVNTRRIRTLSQLAASALAEKTTSRACATAARMLSANPDDIPFALLYLADAAGASASLEQTVGWFEFGVSARTIDLTRESDTEPWPVADVYDVYRTVGRRIVPVSHIRGLPLAVAGQPVSQAVVLPVTSHGQHPYGVLVTGVNPCRPLDPDHLAFFDLIASQVATAIQNARDIEEERNRADARRKAAEREAELRAEAEAARDRAVSVLESITDGFIALDRDWRITHVNAEAERLNGMRRDDMLGKSHWDIFPASVGTVIHAELLRAARERVSVDFENYYVPWRRWFHIRAFPGADGGLSVFYEDITGRKAAENRAKESERNFREMIDALPAAIYTTDSEGRLTHFNPAAEKLSGRTPQLGTDKWCVTWKLFLPDGTPLPHDQCPMATALKGGPVAEGIECIAERPDGSRFWFTPYPTPLRDSEDHIVGGINMLVDITARKKSEEALRRSEERFRGMFESSAVGVAILTLDYRFSETNQAFSALTGYSAAELSNLDYAGITHCDDRAAMKELVGQLVSGQLVSNEIRTPALEQRCATKNGRTIWVNNSVSLMRDSHGAPEYLIVLCEDVTARRKAEAALRESEERLRAIVDTTPDCVKVVAPDGRLVLMNASGLAMLGAPSAEAAVGKSVFDFIAPEFRDAWRAFHESICRGEKGSLEFDVIGLTGHRRSLESRAVPLPRPDGSNFHLAITTDITERKGRERDRSLLGAIVDSSDDAIISKDLNGIITSWNKGAERMFGYAAEEAIGKSITILVPPDRLQEEPRILARLRRGERVDHFETIRRRKDGALRDISLTISPVKDEHGRIVGASKIARDVTAHRLAEKAIQDLNSQLTFELSAMERIQRVSTRFVEAGDFTELLGDIVEAGIAITGADMGSIQLLEDGALRVVSQRFEAPFIDRSALPDGSAHHDGVRVIVEDVAASSIYDEPGRAALLSAGVRAVQSTPLISRSGQMVGMFSTHYRAPRRPTERELRLLDVLSRQAADLIERKRAEAALLSSESRFRQLADSMPQFVWTANPNGVVDYFNDRWYEFTGIARGTFDDVAWRQSVHPDDHERTLTMWREAVETGTPYRIEHRFWDRRDYRWRWFMGRALPVRDDAGNIVKWFGTSTDIDEQKHVEDELRRANEDLEQFAWSASHDLQEPLRSIKIYSELLNKRYGNKLDGQALDFLGYLRNGATRMEILVRDLLTYTQVTRLDGPAEATDVGEAVAATLASLSGAIAESGATVTTGPLPSVRMHSTHLRQLFQNLIGNAIKYRKPGLPPLVHVSGEKQNGSWIFSVRDNGIGIEPEYKEQVFGLFKRLHTSDEYSGTGIGLAICQRIIERYHGRIWVESEPGRGSDFRFAIPV